MGIIGLGRFGRMAYDYLKEHVRIQVFDSDPAKLRGISHAAGFENVARSDLLLLTVPISALRRLCCRLSPLLSPGQVVVDACSVKSNPVRWMLEELPPQVQVVGTHPLDKRRKVWESVDGFELIKEDEWSQAVEKYKELYAARFEELRKPQPLREFYAITELKQGEKTPENAQNSRKSDKGGDI